MCFSPQADLVGGLVITGVGIDVVRHVRNRRHQLALASLPVLFGLHQLDETFVWWGLQGHVPHSMQLIATWIYLLFAFVVLPVYVPLSAYLFESRAWRRRTMLAFVSMGVAVSSILLVNMLTGHVGAKLMHLHVSYVVGIQSGFLIVAAYVATTCGSLLLASNRAVCVIRPNKYHCGCSACTPHD